MSLKGFEPPTRQEGRCSIQLSYKTHYAFSQESKAGDRESNPHQLKEGWCSTIELHPQESFVFIFADLNIISHIRSSQLQLFYLFFDKNRGDRIRTCDPLVPNQVL